MLKKCGSFVLMPHTGKGHINDVDCFPRIAEKKRAGERARRESQTVEDAHGREGSESGNKEKTRENKHRVKKKLSEGKRETPETEVKKRRGIDSAVQTLGRPRVSAPGCEPCGLLAKRPTAMKSTSAPLLCLLHFLYCVSHLTAQRLSNCKTACIYEWQLTSKLPPRKQENIRLHQCGNDFDSAALSDAACAHESGRHKVPL
ncbi:hypothetical protein F2P81_012993 [Scophthalmus maximus]|uniref:Uncharacterized protein n=1 Tax=Scophthalmus maximus TaxID=52904 RepID=A0A6A4SRP3_SCOMX|nr:hypothetical protein F2P81_012993 [Scophthalmus maximus]